MGRVRRVRPARRLSAGMTLIELLVALMIVSLITTVLAQALSLSRRVESQLDSVSLQARTTTVRTAWLRSTLESVIPMPEGSLDVLQGEEHALHGLSAQVPGWPESAASPFSIELTEAAPGAEHELLLWVGRGAGALRTRIVILAWRGERGKIAYMEEGGRWIPTWPPPNLAAGQSRLPRAIAITTGAGELPSMLVAPMSSGIPRPTRAQVESI